MYKKTLLSRIGELLNGNEDRGWVQKSGELLEDKCRKNLLVQQEAFDWFVRDLILGHKCHVCCIQQLCGAGNTCGRTQHGVIARQQYAIAVVFTVVYAMVVLA